MRQGLVTTIIPVFNRSKMLSEAVTSVLRQNYTNIEIIIIDDGSTDDSLATANALAKKHKSIEVLSIKNSGPALARQHGLDLANGEFIQFLDSDDLLHPQKFTKQVTALNREPDTGISYCVQQLCDEQGSILNSAWMRSGEKFEEMFPAMLGGRIWGTPVPLYRSGLLKRAGPWLNLRNQEDWEYDCRVASLGVKLHYQPEVLVTIRRHTYEHFGDINSKQKMMDKASAYLAIYQHSLTANIAKNNTESLKFNRMTFMLVRQCARLSLIEQSKKLMAICNSGTLSRKRTLEYQIFTIGAFILGWRFMGEISNFIDRLRK